MKGKVVALGMSLAIALAACSEGESRFGEIEGTWRVSGDDLIMEVSGDGKVTSTADVGNCVGDARPDGDAFRIEVECTAAGPVVRVFEPSRDGERAKMYEIDGEFVSDYVRVE